MKTYVPLRRAAFSLIELLVVLSVISVLAALLFPVFLTARGKAREVACVSNLRQIGQGIALYMQDYDGYFPYARAIADERALWPDCAAQFRDDLPRIEPLHRVLKPYVPSPQVFACPADVGAKYTAYDEVTIDAFPTSYEKFGTSYLYLSTLAALHIHESSATDNALQSHSRLRVLYDVSYFWHGSLTPLQPRLNILFADGHVKNTSAAQDAELRQSVPNIVELCGK